MPNPNGMQSFFVGEGIFSADEKAGYYFGQKGHIVVVAKRAEGTVFYGWQANSVWPGRRQSVFQNIDPQSAAINKEG